MRYFPECFNMILKNNHYILFVSLLFLILFNHSLKQKFTSMIKKMLSEYTVIFLSFLIGFILEEVGNIMKIDLSFINSLGWIVLIIYVIKEIKEILLFMKKKGIYIPKPIFHFLSEAEKIIEEENKDETTN